jgi:hypothetical protein
MKVEASKVMENVQYVFCLITYLYHEPEFM